MGEFNLNTVAIIGAGTCGIVTAKHLADAGLSVTVFERSSSVGGIWVFDAQEPLDSSYPNIKPSRAETVPDDSHQHCLNEVSDDYQYIHALSLQHAPPGPAYESLRNNIPTCLMSFRDFPWPEGLSEYVGHETVLKHIRNYAKKHEVDNVIRLNSRVSSVTKQGSKWSIEVATLETVSNHTSYIIKHMQFDAVVLCIGHHSAPKIPDIPGLAELKKGWPQRISHSKSYRRPQNIQGQRILLVGGGVSAFDIAHDLDEYVSTIYQVVRSSSGTIPGEFMPDKVRRVSEIAFLEHMSENREKNNQNADLPAVLPIRVHLVDGQILEEIHSIILCTGYLISYPFLKQFHSDQTQPKDANEQVLVTDGSMLHNLYKDMFYIKDPTLSIVGVPTGTTSLALFEYQAIAIGAVYSGRASLPSENQMREFYHEQRSKKGFGRQAHSLRDEEIKYVEELVKWINEGQTGTGLDTFSQDWFTAYERRQTWLKDVFAKRDSWTASKLSWKNIPSLCSDDGGSYFD